MSEKLKFKPQDCVHIFKVVRALNLPQFHPYHIEDGFVVPLTPMIKHSGFHVSPVGLVDKKVRALVTREWNQLLLATRTLINPHTPFSENDPLVKMAARDLFISGSNLAQILPDANFVLPLSLLITPERTDCITHQDVFSYNSWLPLLRFDPNQQVKCQVLLRPPVGKWHPIKLEISTNSVSAKPPV